MNSVHPASNYLKIIRSLLQSITRTEFIDMKCCDHDIVIGIGNIHRGSRPLVPFLLKGGIFSYLDTMDFDYSETNFCIQYKLSKFKVLIEILFSYEINVFITSFVLYRFFPNKELITEFGESQNVKYKFQKPTREYGIELGPQYCCNILQPFLKKNICRLLNENEIEINLKRWEAYCNAYDLVEELHKRVNVKNDNIEIISSKSFKIKNISEFIEEFHISKFYNFGIIHINNKNQIALAETWYASEGSYGYASSGGFNPTPHFPEYGIAIESYGEFNLKILSLKDIFLIKHLNYVTGIVKHNNFKGILRCTTSEFRENSQIWTSLREIYQLGIFLRQTFQSIEDYARYEDKRYNEKLKDGQIQWITKLGYKFVTNSDGNRVIQVDPDFGQLIKNTDL